MDVTGGSEVRHEFPIRVRGCLDRLASCNHLITVDIVEQRDRFMFEEQAYYDYIPVVYYTLLTLNKEPGLPHCYETGEYRMKKP
jgi:hypothetical protein